MDYLNLTDNEIVEFTVKKDKNAYAGLVTRYQGKLYAYVFRLTNDREEAVDIVQEVFLKAYKNLKSFDNKKKFSSWIYRIAHNESVNWLKKNTRYKKRSIDDDENRIEIADEKTDLHESMLVLQEREELLERLELLPVKYKEVLVLRYIEEKTYEEISLIIKKSANAVGILINRAKKKLSDVYENV